MPQNTPHNIYSYIFLTVTNAADEDDLYSGESVTSVSKKLFSNDGVG